ncbi:MAG: ROK family protein [Tropicimonas sp.]|uniref:ROK family transcriptional regulator n=1 Tax=Tropicimonas sp. TaxID=2067044 RepID=UPI003A87B866
MQTAAGEVLTVLRDEGPASRAELARTIGLSAAALSKLTAELLRLDIVREAPADLHEGLGRPPINLILDREAFLMFGVHVGAGIVEIVVTDTLLGRQDTESFPFERDIAVPNLVERVASTIESMVTRARLPRARIRGIGIAVPGAVDREGRLNVFSAFAQWSNVPFADLLEERLGLPVVLEHNAASIALAETRYGAGRGQERALYVYLGAGIGAGIAYSRTEHPAPRRCRSVEIGHVVTDPDGAACSCGGRGCLETVFSCAALLKAAGLADIPEEGLLAAAMRAADWPERYDAFVQVLSGTVTLMEPDIVVLGGHLGAAPDALFDALRRDIPPRIMPQYRARLSLERTSFTTMASAMGAACAGLESFVYRDPFASPQGRRRRNEVN